MSDIAIVVNDVSKKYTIGAVKRRHDTLRDEVVHRFKSLFRRNGRKASAGGPNEFWAIRDVSFELKRGEALGIIGRNGAGKSTLLKILSRITEPSTGRCEIYGSLGSLLEVGTGFHGELTGRENIYLNGVILGMKKPEVDRKFDEIVAFAEVEKFIDTPVKRYSSGMHVRLAFAVAAHLEPDILIVDEVLAVGDLKFQSRCLGKLGDVARQGRTVLFVSHNLAAVTNLCTTGMWIDQGEVQMRGDVKSVIASYMKQQQGGQTGGGDVSQWRHKGSGEATFVDARLLDVSGEPRETFGMGETLVVEFEVKFPRSFPSLDMSVNIKRVETGLEVLHLLNHDCGAAFENLPVGRHRFSVEIPNCMLYPGTYSVSLYVAVTSSLLDHVEDVLFFSMVQNDVSKRTVPFYPRHGVFHSPSAWQCTRSTRDVAGLEIVGELG